MIQSKNRQKSQQKHPHQTKPPSPEDNFVRYQEETRAKTPSLCKSTLHKQKRPPHTKTPSTYKNALPKQKHPPQTRKIRIIHPKTPTPEGDSVAGGWSCRGRVVRSNNRQKSQQNHPHQTKPPSPEGDFVKYQEETRAKTPSIDKNTFPIQNHPPQTITPSTGKKIRIIHPKTPTPEGDSVAGGWFCPLNT